MVCMRTGGWVLKEGLNVFSWLYASFYYLFSPQSQWPQSPASQLTPLTHTGHLSSHADIHPTRPEDHVPRSLGHTSVGGWEALQSGWQEDPMFPMCFMRPMFLMCPMPVRLLPCTYFP